MFCVKNIPARSGVRRDHSKLVRSEGGKLCYDPEPFSARDAVSISH